MNRATEREIEQLHADFAALCRIPSPSGNERAVADWLTLELTDLGLTVDEDRAGERLGCTAGNLYARLPGPRSGDGAGVDVDANADSLLLCAHMDTVPLTAPLEPVLTDGGWENAGEGILGADNKAAIAVMLGATRRLSALPAAQRPIGLELVFTISEENGLNGAKEFDVGRLVSRFGYVFDHATPIGEVITASPTYHRLTAAFHGRAAHAGLEPELGRSAILAAARAIAAMRLGRLDADTTANVGTIAGGTATNVVPEHCTLVAEVRGLDERRVEEEVTALIDHLHDGADGSECDVDVIGERVFKGYRLPGTAEPVLVAQAALEACGYAPRLVGSGGGSDANVFLAAGFPCANLANGTERAHQPTERVSVAALEGMLHVTHATIEEAAARGT